MIVAKYRPEDGSILNVTEEEDGYSPSEDEIEVDSKHGIGNYKVVDGDLVIRDDLEEVRTIHSLLDEVPVSRRRVSQESRSELDTAREAGDIQTQIDIIVNILTGTDPRETVEK